MRKRSSGEAIFIIEKAPSKKNVIQINPEYLKWDTMVYFHWDEQQVYEKIQPGTYRLNAQNFKKDWESDPKIFTSSKTQSNSSNSQSSSHSPSESSSSQFVGSTGHSGDSTKSSSSALGD